jgi:hypothetical protein
MIPASVIVEDEVVAVFRLPLPVGPLEDLAYVLEDLYGTNLLLRQSGAFLKVTRETRGAGE